MLKAEFVVWDYLGADFSSRPAYAYVQSDLRATQLIIVSLNYQQTAYLSDPTAQIRLHRCIWNYTVCIFTWQDNG